MSGDTEITLIIPVYDEADTIVPLVEEIERTVRPSWRALVIYDRDDDTTLRKVQEVTARRPNIRFVRNHLGPGVVNAFRTGFLEAKTPFVVPIMADLSDMPETVNAMHALIHQGYDLVVASRYAPGGAKIDGIGQEFVNAADILFLNVLMDFIEHELQQ